MSSLPPIPPGWEMVPGLPPIPPGFQVAPDMAPGGIAPGAPPQKSFGLMDTWPARIGKAIYEGVTLPGDVYQGNAAVPQSENMPGGENTENIGRVVDLASVASPVNPAIRAGDQAIPGVAKATRLTNVPTATQLDEAGRAGYKAAHNLGVDIDPAAVQRMAHEIQQRLEAKGLTVDNAPQTYAILRKWQNPPDGAVAATIGNIDSARQALSRINPNPNYPGDVAAAAEGIRGLDVFTSRLPPGSVLAGPASEASKILRDARGNYAAAQRVNKITGELDNAVTGVAEKANLEASAANSGMNFDNRTRQLAVSLLKNRKQLRGFNQDEIAQIKGIAEGTVPQNVARRVGNLLGGGGGFGQAFVGSLGAGAGALASGTPMGAAAGALIPAAVGHGSKALANTLARKHLDELAKSVAMRSPLAKEMAGVQVVSPMQRAALIRAIMLAHQPQQ